MHEANIGQQFHATLREHAERIMQEGFKVGGPSGYGNPDPVHNHGAGVYTAGRFAMTETWHGSIRSSPWHEGKDPDIVDLEVEHPPNARIHTVDTDDWYTRGGTKLPHVEGVKRHLAKHPDLAAHYDPSKATGYGMHDLHHAAHAAGYDAIHIDRGSHASETIWFDPSKLKARGIAPPVRY